MTPEEVRQIIGQIIRRLRKSKNMTQADLAKKLERDAQYVCNVEKGRKNLSTKMIARFMAALDASAHDIFNLQLIQAAA